jgi:hypothetical protein
MMTQGVRYVVTKKSKDGTFRKGDIIVQLHDGSILCQQARGWIDAENVPEATKGMEYEPLTK